MKNEFVRFLERIVLAAILLLIATDISFAYSAGIYSRTSSGCTCHSTGPAGTVSVSISGPVGLAPNTTGQYTVVVTGPAGVTMAGVDIGVNNGAVLNVVSTLLMKSATKNELTQNGTPFTPGTSVTFSVTAPASGTSFIISAAGVATTGQGGANDNWNFSAGNSVTLPVQITSFNAHTATAGNVMLNWSTLSETNNYGFRVQRRSSSENTFVDLVGGFVPGHGTTTIAQQYTYTDATATVGNWFYRLMQIDLDGSMHPSDPVQVSVVATGVGENAPITFALGQNYPNPFNPKTNISYDIPSAQHVLLTVFDLNGREVATLVDGMQEAGHHQVRFDAAHLASGVYLYRLKAGIFVQTKKLALIK